MSASRQPRLRFLRRVQILVSVLAADPATVLHYEMLARQFLAQFGNNAATCAFALREIRGQIAARVSAILSR